MNEPDSLPFFEKLLREEGLGVKIRFREIPLSPETLDTFPKRFRRPSPHISLPLHILSPRQKEVIFALFYDSLSEYETAQLLGISRRSVRVHKMRALQKLKNALLTGNPPCLHHPFSGHPGNL